MKEHFIHVIWGVLIKPKRAMEYALNDSSALHLTLLILFGGWFGTYSTIFNGTLFISNYVNDTVMDGIFFGLVFLLFSIFSKIFKMKATSKDIFYVTLLSGVVSMWMSLISMFLVFFMAMFDTKIEFLFTDSDFVSLIAFIMIIGLSCIYVFYIQVQLLNQVQKVSSKKSFLVVSLTFFTLLTIVMVSKYFEKEQQNLGVSIYEILINNTNSNSQKIKYYEGITNLYEEQDKYEKAIKYYLKAVKIEDDKGSKSEDYYWIAEDYRKLGRIDFALQYAKKSLALTPEDEDSLEQVRDIEEQKLDMQ